MILFTNGCSHTAGVCVLPPLTWPWMLTRSLIDEEWKTPINEIENNPQDYISKDENQLIDYSDHGKSNDLIYYETLHFLLSLQKKGLKPDFVVIQWSGVNRRVHSIPGGSGVNYGLINVNPHDNAEFGPWFEPYASKHTLQLMLHLQMYLKSNDIKYAFIPYMEVDKRNKFLVELDFLDETKCTTSPLIGHRNEFRRKGLSGDTHGHPNLLANYLLTSEVMEILDCGEVKGLSFFTNGKTSLKNEIIKRQYERKFIKDKIDDINEGENEDSYFWSNALKKYKSLI
jgi:hypothetical protein|tara:strand:+ start:3814 stop:4668 length:855 start_codon:yes stop_codon:yes gene_type:complete